MLALLLGCRPQERSPEELAEPKPNTSLAQPLGRWPDEDDLALLESIKGKTKRQVLQILGHPKKVSFNAKGIEMWDYPWKAACRIWLKRVVVIDTDYTAGY